MDFDALFDINSFIWLTWPPTQASVVKNLAPGVIADATKEVPEGGQNRSGSAVKLAPRVLHRSCSLLDYISGAKALVRNHLAQKYATTWRRSTRPLGPGSPWWPQTRYTLLTPSTFLALAQSLAKMKAPPSAPSKDKQIQMVNFTNI